MTSSGATITRKATWAATTILEPGRHLLVANAAGIHAAVADATYTGGLAATGGALVLRPIGGAPVDAVGWGDASSAFVEGLAAPAPAGGSSIERLPGGTLGNGTDTNDNAADFAVQVGANAAEPRAPPDADAGCPSGPTPTPLDLARRRHPHRRRPDADTDTGPRPADPDVRRRRRPDAAPTPTPTPTPTRCRRRRRRRRRPDADRRHRRARAARRIDRRPCAAR